MIKKYQALRIESNGHILYMISVSSLEIKELISSCKVVNHHNHFKNVIGFEHDSIIWNQISGDLGEISLYTEDLLISLPNVVIKDLNHLPDSFLEHEKFPVIVGAKK